MEISSRFRLIVLGVSVAAVLLVVGGGTEMPRHELDFTLVKGIITIVSVVAASIAYSDSLSEAVSGLFYRMTHPVESDARKIRP